ncbi:MAG: hypothetical protein DCC75_07990, partial [Proteobacteria bacterium]
MQNGLNYLNSLKEWVGDITEFSLEPIKLVLAALGDPQDKIPSIHVAGTNGKGSVCAMVAAGLASTGARVGLTTSPHLTRLNERIVIDGRAISDELLNEFSELVCRAASKVNTKLSFFEAMIATAFLVFEQESLDWMVVEVGLGGRLDSSNVISRPEVASIVTVALDHQAMLGATIREIAAEKAGIIKTGSLCTIGPVEDEAFIEISRRADDHNVKIERFGRDFGLDLNYSGTEGSYQKINHAVAANILKQLGFLSDEVLESATKAYWPARLEWLEHTGRKLLIDCAHNPAGVGALCEYLTSQSLTGLTVIFGALETKNWNTMIDSLRDFGSEWVIFEPDHAKAVSAERIGEYLSRNEISFSVMGREYEKLEEIIQSTSMERSILITGSIYLVGKLREQLVKER